MEYIFEKYRINKNDYLVFDVERFDYELSTEKIRKICRHHFGVGVSGVIMGPYMSGDKIRMRMFRADGTEEDRNINAICAFSQFLREQGYVKENSFVLETITGDVEVEVCDVVEGGYHVYMEQKVDNSTLTDTKEPVSELSEEDELKGTIHSNLLAAAVEEKVKTETYNKRMICMTGKVKQTGRIITADHFIENL